MRPAQSKWQELASSSPIQLSAANLAVYDLAPLSMIKVEPPEFKKPSCPAASKHAGATIAFMIDWSSCSAVESDPERVSGAWVFRGSRVPVAALFENLEDGVPVGEFVDLFPGVTLDQARAVLEHAARSALTAA